MQNKDGLAGDYCYIQNEGTLSDFERLTYLDDSKLTKAGTRVGLQLDALEIGRLLQGYDKAQLMQDAEIYRLHEGDRASLLKQPKGVVNPKIIPLHGLTDGEILSLSFESHYVPFLPRLSEFYRKAIENRFFRARWWKHATGSRETIVAFHGIHMGDQRVSSLIFQPGIFYKAGYDVVLVELPFHGKRTYGKADMFPHGDLALLTESILQTAVDFQTLRMFLALEGRREIGVLGLSFGAYISFFLSTLYDLKFCVGIAPIVSISEIIIRELFRDEIKDDFRCAITDICRSHEPLQGNPKTAPRNIFIVSGEKDHVSIKDSLSRLISQWSLTSISSEEDLGHGLSGQFVAYANRVVDFLSCRIVSSSSDT